MQVVSNNDPQLRLAVGETIIGLNWPSSEICAMAQKYFGFENQEGNPDLTLEINIINQRIVPEIPDSLFAGKHIAGQSFNISNGLIKGTYDRTRRHGKLDVLSPLLDGTFVRVFEQILYQAYYSAIPSGDTDTFLVHSAGVIRNGNGYLFAGASEKGKSTIAGLSKEYHVLNDEINLVMLPDNGIFVEGTPFNGFFHDKSVGHAPLKAVFLLEHGREHELAHVSPAESVKTIMSQIVPPVGLDETMTHMTKIQMFDYAEKIEKNIPVCRLWFKRDDGFWNIIDRHDL